MKFSIITPSFRNSNWLKLCIASVADQQGVEFEHIVQDSCSDDGTQDWLPRDPRVKAFIEKDGGMYDAVNRGYRRAQGDILAYLNCDEQYLPGALKTVHDFFESHPPNRSRPRRECRHRRRGEIHLPSPRAGAASARLLVLFPGADQFDFHPAAGHSRARHFFDPRWRDLGDFHWVRALMKTGCRWPSALTSLPPSPTPAKT
jgi:glycosyltransferase involved in cell wall biosynthesis